MPKYADKAREGARQRSLDRVWLVADWLTERVGEKCIVAHQVGEDIEIFTGKLAQVWKVEKSSCFGFSAAGRTWTGFDSFQVWPDRRQISFVYLNETETRHSVTFALCLPGVEPKEWITGWGDTQTLIDIVSGKAGGKVV